MSLISRVRRSLLIGIAFLPFACMAAGGQPCPALPSDRDAELRIADFAGRAVLFPNHPDYGIERTTTCLLRLFGDQDRALGALGAVVSNALLMILTVDPSRWFLVAAKTDRSHIDAWLGRPLLASQLLGVGKCAAPDKFEQARRSITALRFTDPAQDELRARLVAVLGRLHCETAT